MIGATEIYEHFVFYFQAGGFVMPPLVLATFVLWYGLGYRFFAINRGNVRSVRTLAERWSTGEFGEPKGIVDSAVAKGLELQKKIPSRELRDYLDDAFSPLEQEIGKFRILVQTLVAFAPLAGLLGTVTGMIETFDSLGDMSLYSQSGGIAGGISQALFTTQMGLVVAVPGMLIGRALERRQAVIEMELAQLKDILCSRENGENGENA